MKYYKVVKIKEGRMFSSINHGEYTVEYKVGEWVYPKLAQSALMVFDSLGEVIRFIKSNNVRAYECEIKPFDLKRPQRLAIYPKDYKDIWEYGELSYLLDEFSLPRNTCFASAVKLLKPVMSRSEALKEIGKYEPCPHFTIDTNLGNGKIWARCDDCGQEFKQENLERYRESNERFLEAMEILNELGNR